jgi:hypothetical protein
MTFFVLLTTPLVERFMVEAVLVLCSVLVRGVTVDYRVWWDVEVLVMTVTEINTKKFLLLLQQTLIRLATLF